MATYNGELFLAKQIESILAQSYNNIQLIIVDDCSTDKTLEIIYKYKHYHNVRIYQNEKRLGVIKNFEKAIFLCDGRYIAFSDQDDIWLESKLEILMENINNSVLVCSDTKLIDENDCIISNSFFKSIKLKVPSLEKLFYKVVYESFILGCTMLFDIDTLKKVFPIPINSNSHDWWITVNSAALEKVKIIEQPLMLKRVHQKNIYTYYYDNLFIRFKNYFTRGADNVRQKRFEVGIERINCYLDKQIWTNEKQYLYLQAMKRFYLGMIEDKLHFESFKVILKYRNYIYEGMNPITKFAHIFAKLI